jgi:hypothetical protein
MKKNKISLILNIIIVVLVGLGTIFMFTGIKFMPDNAHLEERGLSMFKYYTVDSNILVGFASFLLVIFNILLLKKKIKQIPSLIYIIKMIATAGISITFLVTFFLLVPQHGLYAMYNNNNLFFHLIVPILALVSFIGYEQYDSKYRQAGLGLIPMTVYSIYYLTNIVTHLDQVAIYDFYGFLKGDINNMYYVIPVMFIGAYVISLLIIFINKKISD